MQFANEKLDRAHCGSWQWAQLRALAVIAFMLLLGCSSHAQRLLSPRQDFYANNLTTAHQQLSELEEEPKQDASVIDLDLAMIEMFSGNLTGAEHRLRRVRDSWDHLEQDSLAESATSYVTDDLKRAYHGEDYEKLLVRVMLTLTSLMRDGTDAESYSLQTLEKQLDLVGQAREKWDEELADEYCIPPIAPYLRGVLREATLTNYDDARRYYEIAASLLPEGSFVESDIERAKSGTHSRPGHGVVYVVAMVGRGPYKVETRERATQHALLVADQILSAVGEYSVPPTLAPVKIPDIVSPPKPFDLIGIEVDGTPVTTTLPIADLNQIAVDSYAHKRPQVIARAVARRVIKKGAVYAAKDQFEATSDLASVAFDAAGVLWEASESADTRCWGLLPREIQIVRLELPQGRHRLALEPVSDARPVGPAAGCDVDVLDGRNTFILSYWPGLQPVGEILVSGQ